MMEATDRDARYVRYKSVIDAVCDCEAFDLGQIKKVCADEQPAFVSKVVTELEIHGWLVRENNSANPSYRWSYRQPQFSTENWLNKKIHGTQVKQTPEEDRPRERLLKNGAASLKTSELVAILIRSGREGESCVQAGEKIANKFGERLETLPDASRNELWKISSVVGEPVFCQIMAGVELGRRVAESSSEISPDRMTTVSHKSKNKGLVKIAGTDDAFKFCESHFSRLVDDSKKEEFHIVCLDTKNHVIDTHQISVGTLDASLVHPREVFRPAIKDSASSVILVHNHPSGDPTPSPEDFQVTDRLEKVGKSIGIDVLDHIVLGSFRSVSIREQR